MLIYLAGRYSRRLELEVKAEELRDAGHRVEAQWLTGDHEWQGRSGKAQFSTELAQRWALEDLNDVLAADCVISFTEEPRTELNRGGRHIEFGIALAAGKRLLVVGWRENIFHTLPQVEFYERWSEALAALGTGADKEKRA